MNMLHGLGHALSRLPRLVSLRMRDASRRRDRLTVLTLVACGLVGGLAVGQGVSWRAQAAEHRERLMDRHASLVWQLERTRAAQRDYLARTDRGSVTALTADIATALPADVALSGLDFRRETLLTSRPSEARGEPIHEPHPALVVELEAVGRSHASMANFVAALASGGGLRHVTVLESGSARAGKVAHGSDGAVRYRIRAERGLDVSPSFNRDAEVVGVHGN